MKMHRIRTRWMLPGILALAGTAFTFAVTTTPTAAQDLFAIEGTPIYSGKPSDQAGITFGAWGSGSCKESTKTSRGNGRSIEITPKGLYEGGRLDFKTPADATEAFKDSNTYFQVLTRFGNVSSQQGGVGGGMPGMMPGMPPMPGNMLGLPGPDPYGGAGSAKRARKIRVMLTFDNGQSVERIVDVSSFKPLQDGWTAISLPTSVLKGSLDLPAYKIKRVVIGGDGNEPFYVGEIRTFQDTSPLEVETGQDKEVSRNYRVTFQGTCKAGAAGVKYSWDFDDSDGIQEEVIGNVISHSFRKAGDYVVTLTVSDIFGVKKPATSTTKVHVNE